MNLAILANQLGVEGEEFFEIIEIFLETTESDLRKMQSALEKCDSKNAAAAAHSIKGAAGNLGLMEIYDVAAKMETELRESRFDHGMESITTIQRQLDQTRDALRREVAVSDAKA